MGEAFRTSLSWEDLLPTAVVLEELAWAYPFDLSLHPSKFYVEH